VANKARVEAGISASATLEKPKVTGPFAGRTLTWPLGPANPGLAIIVATGLSRDEADTLKRTLQTYTPKFQHLGFHKQADYKDFHGEDH
jgi:hypothetical protein